MVNEHQPVETELKFAVAPDDLAAIAQHPALAAVRRGRGRKATLHTVYFDTPEFDLARAGVALRLRHDGTHWIQSLKGNGHAAGGLHVRDELEWPLPGDALDLGALVGTAYEALFQRPGVRERLGPVFVTKIDRATHELAWPDGTALELALDRGEIQAGRRRLRISEAELELKAGDPGRLFDVARTIAQDVPLRLAHASKAERGLTLAQRIAPSPQKAKRLELDESLAASAALRRIAVACMVQMQANEAGVLAGRDPEYLHQFRVGVRRLRSCLALAQRVVGKDAVALLVAELRWLQGTVGPARDWDVFLADTIAPLARNTGAEDDWAALRARCTRFRRMHAANARAAVLSPRYTSLILRLGEVFARDDLAALQGSATPAPVGVAPDGGPTLDAPLGKFAPLALDTYDRKLRKRGESVPRATPAARHEVRIAAKKLRYAAEFFASLYGARRTERYVRALQSMQDILGALNDAAVVERLLGELASDPKKPVAPYLDGLIRGWVAATVVRELAEYEAAWQRFAERKPFWR